MKFLTKPRPRMLEFSIKVVILFMFLFVAAGWAQQTAPVATSAELPQNNIPTAERVRIGPGDLLSLIVFDVPEMEQMIRVSDKGDAVILLLGSMHLAGMTTHDAQTLIEDKYRSRDLLLDPHVSLMIADYATQGVSVLGEVNKPAVYPLVASRSLLDVISAAGGLTQLAGGTVTVHHQDKTEQVAHLDVTNPEKLVAGDIDLQPGDKVVVARAALIYVVGDVGKPGGFPMPNNGSVTILQAVALASGINHTASATHARIIRKLATGYRETAVNLKNIQQGKAADLALMPEDILVVPSSTAKIVADRGMANTLSAIASAMIYTTRP